MRYRILASFQGAPYEAGVGPDESDVVLFAACPPPEELRFEPATGHWRKRVSRDQVQTLYESRPVGMFRGERCIVLDDLSDRLHIVYLGHDALRAAQLGYWEVDRGVFELITPRHEVTDIVEQRLPLTIRSDSGQHTRPGPMPPEWADDYGTPSGDGASYSRTDLQLTTGPQLFDQRASLDGLPSSYSQELPIAGLSRSEPSAARTADQSDVAIPLVPEAPLPLEAEALRAASSAARRGQKSSQSRLAQEARVARHPQPTVEPAAQAAAGQAQEPSVASAPPTPATPAPAPSPSVAPAQIPVEAAQVTAASAQAAAPTQVQVPRLEIREPAAEVSQPLPAPVPAAAMLSKAAMLSHAAATAARQAATPSKQPNPPTSATAASGEFSSPSEHEGQPRAETGLTPVPATAQWQDEEPEPPATTDRIPLGPDPASQRVELTPPTPEPAPLAPEPGPPAPAPEPAPEPALLAPAPEPALLTPERASEPALVAPEQVGVPAMAVATAPVGQATDTAAHVDRAATEQVAANELVDAHAHGPAEPGQDALPGQDAPTDMPAAASALSSAPVPPVPPSADSPPVVVLAPLAPPSPGQDKPTSPEPAEPASALTAEAAPAQPAPAQPSLPATAIADGNAGTSLLGISDPPSVAHPPSTSAVPSWIPQGPVQPQPGFDVVWSAQPTHETTPSQADYYAPYVANEPVPRNGTATANGAAATADLGLTTPMPTNQPNLSPPPLPPQVERPQPVDEISEPAVEAAADPGTTTRRRRSTRRRLPTQKIFSDLATQAAIPATAYAIGEDVDGAMCLVRTDEGFEVFNAAAGARHEVRVFQDEESAYFYLFGVLVAESVRTGALIPRD